MAIFFVGPLLPIVIKSKMAAATAVVKATGGLKLAGATATSIAPAVKGSTGVAAAAKTGLAVAKSAAKVVGIIEEIGQPTTGSRNPVVGGAATKPNSILSPSASRSVNFGSGIGRADPLALIAPQFEEPTPSPAAQPKEPPAPRPFKPTDDAPRPGLDIDINPGTGTITLAPIDPKGKDLATPSLLDQVTEGGVNLLTPIIDFLKKLQLDIDQIKQGFQLDFSPILKAISEMIAPVMEAIVAIPTTFESNIIKPIMEAITELLIPIANLTATNTEISAKNPRTTSETVAELIAPIAVGISLIGLAIDGLGKAVSGISLKTVTQVPLGMNVAAQIPMGLAASAQIPMGLAASAQIPMGLAASAQIPMGLAASAQIPMGLAASAQIPMGLAASAQIPQTQQVFAELPQSIAVGANLTRIDTELERLSKTAEKTKEDIDKCCKAIKDSLKKKKKEDDDRFPEFKDNGFIECDGATIPYDYAGEGLKGIHQQQNIILGISKMMLKKVCDIEIPAFTFPDIFGGGTYVCDETFGTYNYSGVGLLGLQSQIDRVLDFNKKILDEVCDIEIPAFTFPDIFGGGTYVCDETFGTYHYSGVGLLGLQSQIDRVLDFNKKILDEVCDSNTISGSINFLDCEGGTQVLLYNGEGVAGLSTQVQALTELTKLTYAEACKTVTCVPVQPADEFAEFDVPRQLVLTWGEEYPTQKGSLWHTQIPNPREDLDWCHDFDNLIFTKGNIYGRLLWGNSKIKSGMRCVDEDEAERILDLIAPLSVSEGKMRITKGGGVKLNPAVRPVRCVRAAIAQLDAEGLAVMVKCFVPPIGGCS